MFQQFQLFPNVFVLRFCHCILLYFELSNMSDGARVQRLQIHFMDVVSNSIFPVIDRQQAAAIIEQQPAVECAMQFQHESVKFQVNFDKN